MCTLKPEKLAFLLKSGFFELIFGLLKSILNNYPMLDTDFFPLRIWNYYFETILVNFVNLFNDVNFKDATNVLIRFQLTQTPRSHHGRSSNMSRRQGFEEA